MIINREGEVDYASEVQANAGRKDPNSHHAKPSFLKNRPALFASSYAPQLKSEYRYLLHDRFQFINMDSR